MNGFLDGIMEPLIALNAVALCVWLVSLRRWRIVVGRPDVSRAAHAVSRARSGLGARFVPLVRGIRARFGPWAPTPAAKTRGVRLDDWIDEVERTETRSTDSGESEGSESWWRAWAAAGGKLPGAAGSCRDDAARARVGGRAV